MTRRKWSLVRAEIATGISAGTIYRMAKGLNVAPKTIIEFGRRIGESESRWEQIAIGRDPDEPKPGEPAPPTTLEIIAERDPDLAEFVESYLGLDEGDRPMARALIDRLRRGSADPHRVTRGLGLAPKEIDEGPDDADLDE